MESIIKKCDFDTIRKDIAAIKADTILVIADHSVWSLYAKKIALEDIEGKKIILWKAPDGEKVKNIHEYEICLEFFLEKGVNRNAHLIAVGGGATSDFAGFVASTLLRGISWSIISTTLLSMVDASIGGKVGINANSGKNLIGAFYKPTYIWMNDVLLETLPVSELLSGKGEIVKYAFLDQEIYNAIKNKNHLGLIIELCYKYKVEVVKKDFKEGGSRKILNLGHSLGHAIEKIYPLSHGVSVFWGLALIFKIFHNGKFLNELIELKNSLNMGLLESPWHNRDFPVFKVMEYIKKDKKMVSSDELDLVLIKDIGSPYVQSYNLNVIEKKLEEARNDIKQFSL